METIELNKELVKHLITFFNNGTAFKYYSISKDINKYLEDNGYKWENKDEHKNVINRLSDKELEQLLLLI
jgi:hypothetical protein